MVQSQSLWGHLVSWCMGRPARPTRRRRGLEPALDLMEDRVVLSRIGFGGGRFGSSLISGGLNQTVATSALRGGGSRGSHGGTNRGGIQDAQLTADLEKLRTDIQGVISGSTVTDAQRQALGSDLKAIADTGFRPDKTALQPVVESLLTSLADGSYDDAASGQAAEIEASFTALFANSTVDSTLIARTYGHLVDVARGLNISTDELNTLAADRAAIQADLTRLGLPTDGKQPDSNLELVLGRGIGRGRGRHF